MTAEQQRAILAIALFAAFADGNKSSAEREQFRQLAQSLDADAHIDLPRLYQDVLLKRIQLTDMTAALREPAQRQLAYEMAVCVCNADHLQGQAETAFLADLQRLLGLDDGQAQALGTPVEDLAAAASLPQDGAWGREAGRVTAGAAAVAAGAVAGGVLVPRADDRTGPEGGVAPAAGIPNVPERELDQTILNSAILNGALELLPQSWASLAIIPLQVKLVYRVGKAYGVELDQGHIKEFIATAGVGLTSQYLEQFGRKLLGGLLGKAAGGLAKSLGKTATSMAFSFATTYALGHMAKRYYAGGRQMNAAMLRESFQNLLEPAKDLQARYLPQIQQTASGLDAAKVMNLVRGA